MAKRITWFCILGAIILIQAAASSAPGDAQPLALVKTIAAPGIKGRIDHLAIDLAGQRLLVAALGNNTLDVIDLRSGTITWSIKGLQEPQAVLFIPELHRLVVSNGGDGTVKIYDSDSYAVKSIVRLSGDADNIRYDPDTRRCYVGYGDRGIAEIDAVRGVLKHSIILRGHPESFQLEKKGVRMYVNVPSAGHIAVVDRKKRSVVASWPLTSASGNFPMALDEEGHRLFIGCRKPARILIYDTSSGTMVSSFEIAGDVDDMYYDASRKNIYASCGQGAVEVFHRSEDDNFARIARIDTGAGARTSLFVLEQSRFYVAVPRSGEREAKILVYDVRP